MRTRNRKGIGNLSEFTVSGLYSLQTHRVVRGEGVGRLGGKGEAIKQKQQQQTSGTDSSVAMTTGKRVGQGEGGTGGRHGE